MSLCTLPDIFTTQNRTPLKSENYYATVTPIKKALKVTKNFV